jgi:hypothetical protein
LRNTLSETGLGGFRKYTVSNRPGGQEDLGNKLSQTGLGGFGSNRTVDFSFFQIVLLTSTIWNKLTMVFNSNSSTEWYYIQNLCKDIFSDVNIDDFTTKTPL